MRRGSITAGTRRFARARQLGVAARDPFGKPGVRGRDAARDLAGELADANDKALKFYGLSREKLLTVGADFGATIAMVVSWTLIGYGRAVAWELPILGTDFTLWRIVISLPIPVLVTVPNAGSGHTAPAGGWPVLRMPRSVSTAAWLGQNSRSET